MSTTKNAVVQTLDQKRAAYAWEKVQGCSGEYTSLAKGAGALIMSNGLMATLAFYQAKGKDHHRALNRHILEWLDKQKKVGSVNFTEAMNSLHNSSSEQYRAATQEALDLLRWIRQFAPVAPTGKEAP